MRDAPDAYPPDRPVFVSAALARGTVQAPDTAADALSGWYRLQLGGHTPQYLLMRAAPSWEAAIALPRPFAHWAGTLVQWLISELLRDRPTLSYRP